MGGKYTDAQKKAILKYQENKTTIKITITPDQKEKYKQLAENKGLNLTQLIVNLLEKESG
jgi:predicted DNA binding CopG/RHH family protein